MFVIGDEDLAKLGGKAGSGQWFDYKNLNSKSRDGVAHYTPCIILKGVPL